MLALITGRGGLPATVAAVQSTPPLIACLAGNAPDSLVADITFRIEQLGSFLLELSNRGVDEVCFCGAITRPVIDPAAIDAYTQPLVPILSQAVAHGEDSALRAIVSVFEKGGFAVRGAHELAPLLLPKAGVLTQTPIPDDMARFTVPAETVLAEQAARDLGQACVIQGDQVIAQEDARGTDAMLVDLAKTNEGLKSGGVLFKAPKPGQDLRMDLPTIGPDTALRAAEAGLDGIVIAAGGVMVLDCVRMVANLDEMGLFLWVR